MDRLYRSKVTLALAMRLCSQTRSREAAKALEMGGSRAKRSDSRVGAVVDEAATPWPLLRMSSSF